VHPAAEMFPLMSEADLKELAEDIKKNGLRNPIVTWSADRSDNSKELLLDGRNRLDAMVAAGITLIDHKLRISCRKIRLYGTGGGLSVFDGSSLTADPYEYVISANIHRRHLTAEQKRDLIGKLLKAKPGSSNLQIAKQVKAC
jgi:ParB-like nuclease domain